MLDSALQVDVNLLAALAAWVAVGVTIYAVRSQIIESRHQSAMQLYLRLYEHYESSYMQSKRLKLAKQLLNDPRTLSLDDTVLVFFETAGVMTRKGLVDKYMMWYTFSVDAYSYWALTHHYIEHVRTEFADNSMFDEFEGFITELKGLDHKHAPGSLAGSADATLRRFLQWELQRVDAGPKATSSET